MLDRWDEIRELADVTLPDDPEATRRLRRKDVLPAELPPRPACRLAEDRRRREPGADPRPPACSPPLLLKAVEGQEFALTFGEKAFVAADLDEAVAAWSRRRTRASRRSCRS